ncbi:MAG: hypothetical protein MOB07_02695 [Acidobacteria bacterium]|nr:hypothetical protein [Acidobacteriota bacterium]
MNRFIALIAIALILGGCQSSSTENKSAATLPTPAPSSSVDAAKKEGEHEHSAPHGGTLVELGEEFAHLEIVLDAAMGKLTAYALDGEAEKAVSLEQPELEIAVKAPRATIKLGGVANSLTGETSSDTSEFAGQSDKLKGASELDGVIKAVSIKGKQFNNVAFNFPKGNEAK